MRITFVGNFSVDYSSESHHAKTLESLGHEVIRLQEAKTNYSTIMVEALQSDLLIWIHTHNWITEKQDLILTTLKEKNIPTITYHLDLWLGLKREQDLFADPFYKNIQYFFTVDKLMADWFNKNTEVKGIYLQAGVFEPECYLDKTGGIQNEVIFVGSKGYHPEWSYRPQLINWLEENYKERFKHFGGDGLGTVRGEALNQLYGSSKIAVGDTLCINFDYPYYWSDRIYETLGRGGFLIHPYIKGIEEHFTDKEHLVFYEYGNFDQLKFLIEYYLYNVEEREKIRKAGHEHVKTNHTYKNRWEFILDEIRRS